MCTCSGGAAIHPGSGYGAPLAADGLSNLAVGRDVDVQAGHCPRHDHDGVAVQGRCFPIRDLSTPGHPDRSPGGTALATVQIDAGLNG